jgi:Mn-containing catalase
MHLKPMKFDRQAAEADPLIAIAGGGGVNLFNSQGNAWTADYLELTGELDVDLRSNIAAEARAKIVYERLINFCDDAGKKDALQFLMTREIIHMKAFALALESMGKPTFSIGRVAPTPGLVNRFFNDSTGTGDHGEIDTRGPWNEGGDWVFTESPAIQAGEPGPATAIVTESSPAADENGLGDLLLDELRDLLHAEKQLTKALPKMAEAACFDQLRELIEQHLAETEAQIAGINECFKFLGKSARAKSCKGMMGLVEEGQEIIDEGEEKEDAAADLALIGAAQRVEHYEMAAYTTARNLAQHLRHSAIVSRLSKSLAEEENADQLLNQVARSLMSVARMPAAVEQTE